MYFYKKRIGMPSTDIKTEIFKLLDNVPENNLQELLDYLKQVQKQKRDNVDFSRHISQILREDQDLLKKLAQ